MTQLESIADALGGRKVLGRQPASEGDFVGMVREGFPCRTFEELSHRIHFSTDEMSDSLRLPKRTLARRRQRAERLTPEESERVLRLARVYARALEVLGGPDKASHWLRTSNRALSGYTPASLLDTDVGTRSVEDVLGRIEHGVFG